MRACYVCISDTAVRVAYMCAWACYVRVGYGLCLDKKARLYILRRRFGVKERFLRMYARVPANAVGLPRSVCVIGVAYAPVIIISPFSRACENIEWKGGIATFEWRVRTALSGADGELRRRYDSGRSASRGVKKEVLAF